MPLYSFDLETYLITDQDKAPKPVCAVWYHGSGQPFLTLPGDDYSYQLWCDPANHFVGQNIAYDILCMCRWHPKFIPFIVRALDEGRVWDTQLRHQLWYLENKGGLGFPKRISLAKLVKFHLGIDRSAAKKGDDIWRLKFGTLDGIPFNQWPLEAVEYVMNDGTDTWNVFHCQGGIENSYATEQLQIRAAVALNAVGVWGHYLNQENVKNLYGEEKAKLDRLGAEIQQLNIVGKGSDANLLQLVAEGWMVCHKDFCQRFAAERGLGFDPAAYDALVATGNYIDVTLRYYQSQNYEGMPMLFWSVDTVNPRDALDQLIKDIPTVPFTSGGKKKHKPKLKTGEDAIKPILPFVHALQVRADYKHTEKKISTYLLPYLGKDTVHPGYNAVVSTGRTSCEHPNTQNVTRTGGLRDNFAPRPGHLLGTVDYSGIEMATLAQTILKRQGSSILAEKIDEGVDLHCDTAAFFTGKSYEHMVANKSHDPEKGERQGAKACYSADTELLTRDGWQPIHKLYGLTNDVAQYCPHTKEISFVTPLGWMCAVREVIELSHTHMDCCVSLNHRMLRVSRNGLVSEVLAGDMVSGESYCSVHGGYFKKATGSFSDIETRVAVMVQADGSYQNGNVRLGFSKTRKIKRCRHLLEEAKIIYTERCETNGSISFVIHNGLSLVKLDENKSFLDAYSYDWDAFIDELWRWDGHVIKKHTKLYCNTKLCDVEVAQLILTLSGKKSYIKSVIPPNEKHNTMYSVFWYDGDTKKNISYCRLTRVDRKLIKGVQQVFCCGVPTTWLVTRRNGKVTMSGNCNFGIPGGLGRFALCAYAEKEYGVKFSVEEAGKRIRQWKHKWQDVGQYLKDIAWEVSNTDGGTITAVNNSGRMKADCRYTQAANFPFQSLAADGAKNALYYLWREHMLAWAWNFVSPAVLAYEYGREYAGSPLLYSNTVNFVHDEIVQEHRNADFQDDAFARQQEIMVAAMDEYVPDVTVRVEGTLGEHWEH